MDLHAGDQVRVHNYHAYAEIDWTWTGTVVDPGFGEMTVRVEDPGNSPLQAGAETKVLAWKAALMRTAEQVRLAAAIRPPDGGRTRLDPPAVRSVLDAAGFPEHKHHRDAYGFAVGDALWRPEWDQVALEARCPEGEPYTDAARTQVAVLHDVYAETLRAAGFGVAVSGSGITVTLPRPPGAPGPRRPPAARSSRASAWPGTRPRPGTR